MPEVVVIGGGIVGAAVTHHLAAAGASVTLIEEGALGGGTTGATFAWVNANEKMPETYHRLNVAGMNAHAAFAERFDNAAWYHRGGNLEWRIGDADRAAQHEKVERLRAWGYAAEFVDADDVAALEPDLIVPGGDAGFALYQDEAWVDPTHLVGVLLMLARQDGARVVTGGSVTGLVTSGGRVTDVVAGPERHPADVVVNCAGVMAGKVAEMAGTHLPMANSAGFLAYTEAAPVVVNRILHSPTLAIRPDGGGRLLLQARGDQMPVESGEAVFRPGSGELAKSPDALAMLTEARRLLPGLKGIGIESARIGVRPIPADGYPAVGPLPGVGNLYVIATHSAVTMALHLGALVAAEILDGAQEPTLAPYRPERFE